jgi:Transglycosylase SLT domain
MSVDASSASPAAGIDPSRLRVAGAIKQAASTTGTSFEYLLATAKMESNFNPTARASTSSARGLFQFIDQTWLGTVKEAGGQLGYGNYADAITKSASGTYSVSDPVARRAILKLRDDPAASAAMAGVLGRSNSFRLTGKIGRRPTDSELYMAHFMGVGGAAKLISNAEDNPKASGARLFPNAAAANRSIFYERGGRARTVSEVYSVLTQRYVSAATSPATRTAMASVGATPTTAASSTVKPADNLAWLSNFPEVRPATPVAAVSDSTTTGAVQPEQPVFRSLFHAGERAQPVSQAVQELWGNGASFTSAVTAAPQTPKVGAPQPFDLFSDRNGTFSG